MQQRYDNSTNDGVTKREQIKLKRVFATIFYVLGNLAFINNLFQMKCQCHHSQCSSERQNESEYKGNLVQLHDDKQMADCLCRLIEDKALRKRMAFVAKDKSKDFSLNSIIEQWVLFFNALVNGK